MLWAVAIEGALIVGLIIGVMHCRGLAIIAHIRQNELAAAFEELAAHVNLALRPKYVPAPDAYPSGVVISEPIVGFTELPVGVAIFQRDLARAEAQKCADEQQRFNLAALNSLQDGVHA